MPSQSRLARLSGFLAFVADQVLQFWPPYRSETEDGAPDTQQARARQSEHDTRMRTRRSRPESVQVRSAGQR